MAITFLLSNMSDKYPIGNWASAPETVSKKVKKPISVKVKFIEAAYTASKVNTAEWINPVNTELTIPSGDILYSSEIVKFFIFLKDTPFFINLNFVHKMVIFHRKWSTKVPKDWKFDNEYKKSVRHNYFNLKSIFFSQNNGFWKSLFEPIFWKIYPKKVWFIFYCEILEKILHN